MQLGKKGYKKNFRPLFLWALPSFASDERGFARIYEGEESLAQVRRIVVGERLSVRSVQGQGLCLAKEAGRKLVSGGCSRFALSHRIKRGLLVSRFESCDLLWRK